jgi:hypothetical protein
MILFLFIKEENQENVQPSGLCMQSRKKRVCEAKQKKDRERSAFLLQLELVTKVYWIENVLKFFNAEK